MLPLRACILVRLLLAFGWLNSLSVSCLTNAADVQLNVTSYCVKPDSGPKGNMSCHPLSYYVDNSSRYFTSNTELVFLPGVFILHDVISVSLVDTLSLVGGGRGDSASLVQCSHSTPAGIAITNSSNIAIHSLAFLQCSNSAVSIENNYMSTALAFVNVTNLTVSGATVNESAGIGLFIYEAFGTLRISNSLLANNSQFNDSYLKHYTSGNAFIVIKDCPFDGSHTRLFINSSSFLFGSPCYDCPAPGLYLQIETHECTTVSVCITHCNFSGNNNSFYVRRGGNVGIDYICYTGFKNVAIDFNNNTIENGNAFYGGGLHVNISSRPYRFHYQPKDEELSVCSYTLTINHNHFAGNTAGIEGGGLFITNSFKTVFGGAVQGNVSVNDCTFFNNRVKGLGYGAAAFVNSFLTFLKQKISSFILAFNNCHFSDNVTPGAGAVYILEANDGVYFTNCTFTNNRQTALSVVRSNVIFKGNITFLGNSGYNGGGVSFCSRSYAYFLNNTFVLFQNNTAQHSGGGIYVASQCPLTKPGCFFQFLVNIETMIVSKSVQIVMKNNTAFRAGSAIYGAYVDDCYVIGTPSASRNVFHKVFQVPSLSLQDMSPVSSAPSQVCFCNSTGLPDCTIQSMAHSVFPGERMSVFAVAVGEGNGVVPAVVVAGPFNNTLIQAGEKVQSVGRRCINLNYTLYRLNGSRFSLGLDIEKPELYENGHNPSPKRLNITFKPCPIGFARKLNPGHCDCTDTLRRENSSCGFKNGLPIIQRLQGIWIGVKNITVSGNKFPALLTYSKCLFHYCTLSPSIIELEINGSNITNQNSQCVKKRVGVLCGSCREGYSVTTGEFDCHNCSETNLLLTIIMFLLSGVLLVGLLFLCNLTVSEGTINGLIFYVNIVQYTVLYFYAGSIDWVKHILRNFVAVMNLSYGNGICMFNGMNAYAKVWLDYTFPLYVSLVTAALILVSRRSIRVSQLLGNNTPKVIATLFLLMYVKVIQTAIYGVSSAGLSYESEDGTPQYGTIKVWLYDGNIEYLRGRHIYLFAFSVIVIALSFPYTLSLLLIQPLRSHSHLRPLRWVQRLKPLFDAYTGPYKTRYHFWPGLLLLARNLLLVVFAVNSGGDPTVGLTCVVLVCSILQAVAWGLGGVYRKRALDALESFFFFNLTFVSLATAFSINHHVQTIATDLAGLSGFTSLLFTLLLLLYHCYKQAKRSQVLANCCYRLCLRMKQIRQLPNNRHTSEDARCLVSSVSQVEEQRDEERSQTVECDSDREGMTEYSQLLSQSHM